MKFSKYVKKMTVKMFFVSVMIILWFYFARPEIRFMLPGAVMVVIGEFIRLWAAGHLEKNMKVVTTGPYAFVKNPLYIGTFLIMSGLCLMAVNYWILLAGIAVFIVYYAPYKMKVEYSRLEERFGAEFSNYNNAVPDYIPNIRPYRSGDTQKWSFKRIVTNEEHLTCFSTMSGIGLMFLKYYNIINWGFSY